MNNSKITRIRKPVRREGAEKYLLVTLLSFAASVSLTRLFLELTNYPQIGNGTLHIAHVLWGGLFLYIACLLPLLVANRWVYYVVAALSGIGVGLFIDEVGKFITQTNDYFFPAAAPIIYAFFLLTVLLYRQVKRPREKTIRTELYCILDGLEEVLDHDLSDRERSDLIERLDEISADTTHPDLYNLAQSIRQFITNEKLSIFPESPNLVDRLFLKLRTLEKRWITPRSYRAILTGGLFAMALWILYYPILILIQSFQPEQMSMIIEELVNSRLINTESGLNWFQARLALQTSVGIILLISSILLVTGRLRRGIDFGYLGLLLSLTTVNLLMFYFDQFSTIVSAMIQFGLFMGILYYKRYYMVHTRG